MESLLAFSSKVKVGNKYGKRTVLGVPFIVKACHPSSGLRREIHCVCQCDCGHVAIVHVGDLTRTRSTGRCHGCVRRTHGGSFTPLNNKWRGMLRRCYNPNDKRYGDYGGRGILVCPEWRHDFAAFRDWALANGYEPGLQIDRKDNDLGYSPENCQWVSGITNANNKRSSVVLTAFGEAKTAAQWTRDSRCAVGGMVLRKRVSNGWTHEDAITTKPLRGRQCQLYFKKRTCRQ